MSAVIEDIIKKEADRCENDEFMSTSAPKRKCQPEVSHLCSKEMKMHNDDKIIIELTDMCDDVIDSILCHLQLEDLANVAETNTRLKSIAGSVFSRKHAHRLISFDAFHYSRELNASQREYMEKDCIVYCGHRPIVRITVAKFWFKLIRNFGGSIKFMRIQGCHYERDTTILSALQNLMKYISEFCSDSLYTLEVYKFPFFTLNKSLKKLKELFLHGDLSSELMELMPEVHFLILPCVPRVLEKCYAKLQRVELSLENDEEVHSFNLFLRMNPQIKFLRLWVRHTCDSAHNDSIYSSIAENLTQLKILKLFITNKPSTISTYPIKTLTSFSFTTLLHRSVIPFELNDLRIFSLKGAYFVDYLNFILSNKKLKILEFDRLDQTCLKATIIRNMLSELPELQQIIVRSSDEKNYPILKNILGMEWEQIELKSNDTFKSKRIRRFQLFKKKLNNKMINWKN